MPNKGVERDDSSTARLGQVVALGLLATEAGFLLASLSQADVLAEILQGDTFGTPSVGEFCKAKCLWRILEWK